MSHHRRGPLSFLALAAVAGVAIASCGGEDASSTAGLDYTETTELLSAAERTILDQLIEYPTDTPAQVTAGVVVLEPGQETGLHRHDTPLVVHVLRGTVTVTYDDGIVKEYPAGSTFVEAIGTHHNGRNDTDEKVLIYTVSIGAEGLSNTVRL
jgi:quercetin dioxygenase-like cupin family protein